MAGSVGQYCSPAELGGLWRGLHGRWTLLGLTRRPTQPSGPLLSSLGDDLAPACQEGGGHVVCGSQHSSAQGGWWHCLHTQGGASLAGHGVRLRSRPPSRHGSCEGLSEAGGWYDHSSAPTLPAELASSAVSADSAVWSEGLRNDCSAQIQSVSEKSGSQAHLPAIPCSGSGNAQRHPGR